MTKLDVYFDNGQVCTIDVIDNDFTRNLLKSMEQCNDENTKKISRSGNYRIPPKEYDKKKADELVDEINKSIETLKNKYGIIFPEARYDMGHDKCNEIHRYFTHTLRGVPSFGPINLRTNDYERWLDIKRNKNVVSNLKDYFDNVLLQAYYKNETWHNEIIPILCHINDTIHTYEGHISNKIKDYLTNELGQKETTYYEVGFEKRFKIPDEKWYEYCTLEQDYDVTLIKSICGKDYWQCFIDNDDPRYFDIVNVSDEYHPGLAIEPYAPRQKFWRETNFEWFKQYDIPVEDKIIAPLPVGNIDNDFSFDRLLNENPKFYDISIR